MPGSTRWRRGWGVLWLILLDLHCRVVTPSVVSATRGHLLVSAQPSDLTLLWQAVERNVQCLRAFQQLWKQHGSVPGRGTPPPPTRGYVTTRAKHSCDPHAR